MDYMQTDFESAPVEGETREARKRRYAEARKRQAGDVKKNAEYNRLAKKLGKKLMDQFGYPMQATSLHANQRDKALETMRKYGGMTVAPVKPSGADKKKRTGWSVVKGAVEEGIKSSAGKAMSDVLFKVVGTGIGSLFGSPEVGMYVANGLKMVWDNRGLVKSAWNKIKNFFSGLFKSKKKVKYIAASAMSGAKKVFSNLKVPSTMGSTLVKDGVSGASIMKELENLARENIGVAQVLIDKPNAEGVMEMMKAVNKDGFITVDLPASVSSINKLDEEMHNVAEDQARMQTQSATAQEAVEKAMQQNDLNGLNGALTLYNESVRVPPPTSPEGTLIVPNGITQEMIDNGMVLNKVIEDRNTIAFNFEQAKKQIEFLQKSGSDLANQFNRMWREREQATSRQIMQSEEQYKNFLASYDQQLNDVHNKYLELQDSLAIAKTNESMSRNELAVVNQQFKQVTNQMDRLEKERQALSLKASEQELQCTKLEQNNVSLINENRRLQDYIDTLVPRIKQLISEKEAERNALSQKTLEISNNMHKIQEIEALNLQLNAQVEAVKAVNEQSQVLITTQAKELAAARQRGVDITVLQKKLEDAIMRQRTTDQQNAVVVADYEKRIKEGLETITRLQAENVKIKSEYEAAQGQIEAGNSAIVKVEGLNELIKQKEKYFEEIIAKMRSKNDELESTLEYAARLEADLRQALLMKSEAATKHATDVEVWRQQALRLEREYQEQLKKLNDEIARQKEEKGAVSSELEKTKKELAEAKNKLDKMEKAGGRVLDPLGWEKQQTKIEGLQKKVQSLENKKDGSAQIEALKRKIRDKEAYLDKLSHNGGKALFPKQWSDAQAELKKLRAQLKDAEENKAKDEEETIHIEIDETIANTLKNQFREMYRKRAALYRGGPSGIRKRVGGSGGAYLTGGAPDWNLQPNQDIKNFWTNFYQHTYHLF